ncbi:MAG TPA: hypothetical protein VLH15_00565 [Dehalococcoidales bacterium]|nr:hypothetical protein [Dehalococcoidales bacterium]
MTNWQMTAKTILCEAVDDEVTVIINKDGSLRCTGCKKYSEQNDITRALVKQKTRHLKRTLKCEGEDCQRVTAYKQSVFTEEASR